MFLRQIDIEVRKTLAHPALWLGVGGLTALLGGFIVILHLQIVRGFQPMRGGLEQDLADSLALWSFMGSVVYAVCAAVIAAYDYPDRSIHLWLTRGLPRPVLLLARLVVILLFDLLLAGYAVIAALGLAALSRLFFFGRVDFAQMSWSALPAAVLTLFWASLPYLALTVCLAVLGRSPVFAAGATVVYAAVLENMLPGLISRLPAPFPALIDYLPAHLGRALPDMRAVAMIGLMFVALSGAAVVIFSRQDLGA